MSAVDILCTAGRCKSPPPHCDGVKCTNYILVCKTSRYSLMARFQMKHLISWWLWIFSNFVAVTYLGQFWSHIFASLFSIHSLKYIRLQLQNLLYLYDSHMDASTMTITLDVSRNTNVDIVGKLMCNRMFIFSDNNWLWFWFVYILNVRLLTFNILQGHTKTRKS